MRPRFHAPSLDPARDEVVLPEDESRHLSRVLRLKPGAEVEVFDGRGLEFEAVVSAIDRAGVRLRLREPIRREMHPRVRVVLAQAVLKPAQMDDVVRDATMMGVDAIVPLLTAHVAVATRAAAGERALDRWRRIALASAKQCRRAGLPDVRVPQTFESWLVERFPGPRLLLVEPAAAVEARSLRSLLADPVPAEVTLAVGPEGGWSSGEIASGVGAGCLPITLGPLTLRADAVAVVALAGLSVVWGGGEEIGVRPRIRSDSRD